MYKLFFYKVCVYLLSLSATIGIVFVGTPSVHGQTTEATVEKLLTPYLTTPSRRDPNEKIKVSSYQTEIWRYESFEQGDLEKKLCETSRQLFFGRLPSNLGVKELFNRNSTMRELSFVFFRNKTQVTPNLNGQYDQTQQVEVTARMTLLREQVFNLDLEVLKIHLKGSQCVARAKEILSDLWISEKIIARREALSTARIEIRARYPLTPSTTNR